MNQLTCSELLGLLICLLLVTGNINYNRMDKCCCYCENKFSKERKRTVEHLIPLSKGGANNTLNTRDCCNKCNAWRGSKFHLAWAEELRPFAPYGKAPYYYPIDIEKMINNCFKYNIYIKTMDLSLIDKDTIRMTHSCDIIH